MASAIRASDFFANMTIGPDMGSMQAFHEYGLRYKQEKNIQQIKAQMGFDKQRYWS